MFNHSIYPEFNQEVREQCLEIMTPMPRRCTTEEFTCPSPSIEDGNPDAESRAITDSDSATVKKHPQALAQASSQSYDDVRPTSSEKQMFSDPSNASATTAILTENEIEDPDAKLGLLSTTKNTICKRSTLNSSP